MFAAIYHPVGIAMVVAVPARMGRALGWNGLWGNLGLATAAILSGALMDWLGWRMAFFVPGIAAMAAGAAFLLLVPDPGRCPGSRGASACTSTARTRRGSSRSSSWRPPAAG